MNMKSEFKSWMKNQKMKSGNNYSDSTIDSYITAIKNSTAKLELDKDVLTALFLYTSPSEFDDARQLIIKAPNFAEVNNASSHHSYSSGIKMYEKFLKEVYAPSSWIFQFNPKSFDYEEETKYEDSIPWIIKNYRNKIKKGDRVYIWRSGKNAGIVSRGTITCNPEVKVKLDKNIGVDIKVEPQFKNVITKELLKSDERTRNLGVIKMPRPTTYPVKKEEEEVIDSIINGDYEPMPNENVEMHNGYTKQDFLNDVFMTSEQYDTLTRLLNRKHNVILQGAPGVGKTYAAKRLAWSIIGEKDEDRICFVQFHQSYSYEDFVAGYRPKSNGFSLEYGTFYYFCQKAEKSIENKYFFIIDEINRGSLSKIFGELLMLIEADKRGEEHSVNLIYSKNSKKREYFFVPENVYIIGMMNTADRGIAMVDYALRRRFSFFYMQPAFDSEGFSQKMKEANNSKFNSLIKVVKLLNEDIKNDVSLGKGFCIGHSYFCADDCSDDALLSEIVEYELIPLIQEYWFDDEAKSGSWSNELRSAIK